MRRPLEFGVRLCDLLTWIPWTYQVDPADLFGSVREGGRHAQASPPSLPLVAVTRYNNKLIASFSWALCVPIQPRPAMSTRSANTAGRVARQDEVSTVIRHFDWCHSHPVWFYSIAWW